MNINKKIAGLLSLVLIFVMVMPLTVSAEFDEPYIVEMTPEEVSAILLERGINLDKEVIPRAELIEAYLDVVSERSNNRIAVTYYTYGSIVANEIGMQSLDFYESKTSGGWTTLLSDYKDFDCFKQVYAGGFYYNAPISGRKYYAAGTNYAIFTTTRRNLFNSSPEITY